MDALVVEVDQPLEVELTESDRGGERAAVARLLAAETDRQQLGVAQFEEPRRRQRVGDRP